MSSNFVDQSRSILLIPAPYKCYIFLESLNQILLIEIEICLFSSLKGSEWLYKSSIFQENPSSTKQASKYGK